MENLEGKIALVTGASRGLGRAAALALAKAGVDVAVNFRDREKEAREVCAQIESLNRRVIAVRADVSISDDVKLLVEKVEEGLGVIDILEADVVVMLARNGYITGQTINVNGGWYMS